MEGKKNFNALISVFDKTGIASFAAELVKLGFNIYASGGTAKEIAAAGIKAKDISELVGGKAILGHRVVTLSREINAGLLANNSAGHQAELKKLGIPRIDLVCVDMYPLVETINNPKATEAEVIEKTDIGGPTMLRAAAKGRRIVICRPEQRQTVLEWLKAGRPDGKNFLTALAAVAEFEVARYVFSSAKYLGGGEFGGFIGQLADKTKYGENPWQKNAGFYTEGLSEDRLALDWWQQRGGTKLSYNNYADVDRLLQTITHIAAGFDKNFGSVGFIALGAKHGNVCGAAVSTTPKTAIAKMLDGDARAIFGGSVMLNFPVGQAEAKLLLEHAMPTGQKRLLDVIAAPQFSKDALQMLQRKGGKLRLFANPALAKLDQNSLDVSERFRYVRGGALVQSNYTYILDIKSAELEKTGQATEPQIKDMILAWGVGSTSNSNTITLVKDGMLIGNGVGQQDRVSAAELGLKRARDAGHDISGAVAFSDSFFPFADGPLELTDAGVQAILATRGSVNDAKVAAALKKAGVIFCTLPDASARAFFGH